MAENSKIEWTDHTFNPWMGCTAISPACDHCYAEAQTARFKQVGWGAHAPRKRTRAANWNKPLQWNAKAAKLGIRQKVFCASLADVFDNHASIDESWRQDLWDLICDTPCLDWLLLTKRPQNYAKFLPADWGNGYPNVWLGVTVENQTEADRRIPILLNTPAAKRFLSCEPLLEKVIVSLVSLGPGKYPGARVVGDTIEPLAGQIVRGTATGYDFQPCPKIDWVICGGESGLHARPMHPDWARSLRDQCQAAGVPFFFKQWGEWGDFTNAPHTAGLVEDRVILPEGGVVGGGHPKYGGLVTDDWKERGAAWMCRVGKKQSGHLLDGQEWRQFPEGDA
ncbi:phage Gp37/Gp68 family protein [uncultured Cohaesibacter sp.]|uniref:phage Gp37/Gp68 family protein n=1 Tax=uncultured Cohaesibacter sp. TaxID=1002546 RepID=UPI0029C9A098|nr:phage Gp37/Gp68 family protein [uncultured Cohaesibacter sp.]